MGKSERAEGQKDFFTAGSAAETLVMFGKKSLHILCNMKVYKGMPLVPILNQVKPNSLPSSLFENNFNIILPFVTRSS